MKRNFETLFLNGTIKSIQKNARSAKTTMNDETASVLLELGA